MTPEPEEAASSRFHELYTLEDGMYVRNEMPKRDEGLETALAQPIEGEAAGEVKLPELDDSKEFATVAEELAEYLVQRNAQLLATLRELQRVNGNYAALERMFFRMEARCDKECEENDALKAELAEQAALKVLSDQCAALTESSLQSVTAELQRVREGNAELRVREEQVASLTDELAELQRLREELAAMTVDRNLWQGEHNEDCPNLAELRRREGESPEDAWKRAFSHASMYGWVASLGDEIPEYIAPEREESQ